MSSFLLTHPIPAGTRVFCHFRAGLWRILKVKEVKLTRNDIYAMNFLNKEEKVYKYRDKNVGDTKEYEYVMQRVQFLEKSDAAAFSKEFGKEVVVYEEQVKQVVTDETLNDMIVQRQFEIQMIEDLKDNPVKIVRNVIPPSELVPQNVTLTINDNKPEEVLSQREEIKRTQKAVLGVFVVYVFLLIVISSKLATCWL